MCGRCQLNYRGKKACSNDKNFPKLVNFRRKVKRFLQFHLYKFNKNCDYRNFTKMVTMSSKQSKHVTLLLKENYEIVQLLF